MVPPLHDRQSNSDQDPTCPSIDGKTVSTRGETFQFRCDWVLFNGNCSIYTGIDSCINTCIGTEGCVAVTINQDWDDGCCIPSGLDGQTNEGWITAWNTDEVERPGASVSATGTFTIEYPSASTGSFTTGGLDSSTAAVTSGMASTTDSSLPASPTTPIVASSDVAPAQAGALSPGAKAGIGVGAGICGLAVLACALYFAFWLGRRRQTPPPAADEPDALQVGMSQQGQGPPMPKGRQPMQEIETNGGIHEAAGAERFELGEAR